jgi:hypothetical protein
MNKVLPIITLLAILAGGCTGKKNREQTGTGTVASGSALISDSFQNYLNYFREIDLPIAIDVCTYEAKGLHYFEDETYHAYGRLPANGNYIAVLTLTVADCFLPVLTTYKHSGEKIDEKQLAIGCGADIGWYCDETMAINDDFTILVADTITSFEVDSVGEELPETRRHYVRYVEGKLLPDGTIALDEMKEKDLPPVAGESVVKLLDFGFKITAGKEEDFETFKTYSYFQLERNGSVVYLDSADAEYEFGNLLFPLVLPVGDNCFEVLVEVNDRPTKNHAKRLFVCNDKLVGQDKLPAFEAKPADIDGNGTEEYAGYWDYAEVWGENDHLTAYNPILYYSATATGMQLDSLLTRQRNKMIYGQFHGYSFSGEKEQPVSVIARFKQELERINTVK